MSVNLSNAEKDVLLKIYIAQNIRAPGVRQSDIQEKEITQSLLSHNLIAEERWYSFDVFSTTELGDKFGQEILEHRIAETRENIKKKFQELPPRVFAFIIKRFVLYDTSFTKEKPSKPTAFNYWPERIWEKRILSDGRIWINWLKFFDILKSFGLSVVVNSYVSTRGGELRGPYYVINGKIKDLLSKLDVGTDFNDDEVNKLKLYSFLLLSINLLLHFNFNDIDEAKTRLYELMKTYDIDEGQLGGIIMEMSKDKITSEYRGFYSETSPYDIHDENKFYEYIETNIIKPAINILFGQRSAMTNYQPFQKIKTLNEIGSELESLEQIKLSVEINKFENGLRDFIKRKLGKGWNKRIENDLPDVMESWRRKEKDDKNAGREPEKDLINYTDFEDYIEIIKKYSGIFSSNSEDLWRIIFNLEQLKKFGRNPLFHSRIITQDDIAVARQAIKFLRRRLGIEDGNINQENR